MITTPKRGLRSFYPTDKGPIDLYQLGHDGRIEYLAAQISTDHLTKGISTTDEWKKWARERGAETDEPGLVLSKRLGGSGIDSINLFPKSPLLGKTSWATDEEKAFKEASEMKKWKKLKFFVKLEYAKQDSLRPSELEYQYDLPSGDKVHGKVLNAEEITAPKPEEKVIGGGEEEEESEYEYEYEEEEEEDVEVEPKDSTAETTSPGNKIEEQPHAPVPSNKENSPVAAVTATSKEGSILKTEPSASVPLKQPSSPPISAKEEIRPPVLPSAITDETIKPKFNPETVVSSEENTKNATPRIFAGSDLIEMLPIFGSIKLALDTVKAISNKDAKRTLWKGIQFSISIFADFHFMRAFARHGKLLMQPITEEKLVRFANKAEPRIIIFVVCKAGNQVLSIIRRVLSNSKT